MTDYDDPFVKDSKQDCSQSWYKDELDDAEILSSPVNEFDGESDLDDYDTWGISEDESIITGSETDSADLGEADEVEDDYSYDSADQTNPNAFVSYLPEMCKQAGFDLDDWMHGGVQKRREITQKMVEMRDSGVPAIAELAGNIMYELHKGFIWSIIKRRYSSYIKQYGDDLRQAGAIGFVEAFKSLNPQYMLTTHVLRFVLHHVSEFIATYINRTTTYRSSHIQQVYRAEQQLIKAGIQNPGAYEIAIESGLNIVLVETAMQIRTGSQTRSIEEGMPVDNDVAKKNEIMTSPVEHVIRSEEEETVYHALMNLSEEEREVLIRRNGYAVPKSSFSDIHRDLGIPINSVRILQHRAERKVIKMNRIKRVFSDQAERAEREKAKRQKVAKHTIDNLEDAVKDRQTLIVASQDAKVWPVSIHHSVKDTNIKLQKKKEAIINGSDTSNLVVF